MSATVSLVDSDPYADNVLLPATNRIKACVRLAAFAVHCEGENPHNTYAPNVLRARFRQRHPEPDYANATATADWMKAVCDEVFENVTCAEEPNGNIRFSWEGEDGEGQIASLMWLLCDLLYDKSSVRFVDEYGNMWGYETHDGKVYETATSIRWKRMPQPYDDEMDGDVKTYVEEMFAIFRPTDDAAAQAMEQGHGQEHSDA